MTTYQLPADQNGILYDGVSVPNTGLYPQRGRVVQTDTNGQTSAVNESFPIGVTGALNSAVTPSSLLSGTAATIGFGTSLYHRVMIQNNAAVTIYFWFDGPATVGAFQLAAGSLFEFDTGSALSLYQNSGSAIPINTASSGITVLAW